MQKTRIAATFGLLLFLVSATPSFAVASRDSADPRRDLSPFERIVQVIKRLVVKPLDNLVVPKP